MTLGSGFTRRHDILLVSRSRTYEDFVKFSGDYDSLHRGGGNAFHGRAATASVLTRLRRLPALPQAKLIKITAQLHGSRRDLRVSFCLIGDVIVFIVTVIHLFTITSIYTFSGLIDINLLDFVLLLWRDEICQDATIGLHSAKPLGLGTSFRDRCQCIHA